MPDGVRSVRSVTKVRRVTHVSMSAVPGVPRVAEVRQSTDRHRGEPGATEREAEAVEIHTKYYVSNGGG